MICISIIFSYSCHSKNNTSTVATKTTAVESNDTSGLFWKFPGFSLEFGSVDNFKVISNEEQDIKLEKDCNGRKSVSIKNDETGKIATIHNINGK